MNICFYNSARHPIVTLFGREQVSRECVSFNIEVCGHEYEALINGSTEKGVFRILYDEFETLYNGEQSDVHVETTDGSLEIAASMDVSGIIFWKFVLTEVGTKNRIEVKDCSDRTFLPEIMKSLTEWIEEDGV